jgi:aldehyde:ferredoxin oxidoreductase
MKKDYLYAGRILWVDLTQGKVWTTPTAEFAQRFLGGQGIAVRIAWGKPGLPLIDPLGPDNVLCFSSGPLTGTMMPGAGHCQVTGKSPLTELLGVTSFGGGFASELKYAGYDHVVITGQAAQPVYLVINNEEVTIRSAADVWGLDTYETPKVLSKELKNEEIQWACIGSAGERLVRFATIVGNTRDSVGRAGLGAVMGSKKLKAIAVSGTGGLRVADPKRFYEACADAMNVLKAKDPSVKMRLKDSSRKENAVDGRLSSLPKTNVSDEGAQKRGCFGCPMCYVEQYGTPGIGNGVVCDQGYGYLNARIGVRDGLTLQKLMLCIKKDGYDAVLFADVAAWVTDLYEQGIIGEKDLGFRLIRGDEQAYMMLAEMIANREGIGDVLADGMIHAARKIGRGAECSVMRRIEAVADPSKDGSAESLQESAPFYGHFAEAITGSLAVPLGDEADGAQTIMNAEDAIGRADMVGSCRWHTEFDRMPITADVLAQVLSAGLGKKITADELTGAQQRARHLERAFNCREGLRRSHDTPSENVFANWEPDGRFEAVIMDRSRFEAIKDRYYALRGWDLATGVPTRRTLESSGLKDVADALERQGIIGNAKKG